MSALEWFAHKSLGGGIYWIQERFYESGNRANIWLVRGSQRDVVIDTGLGLRSLPDYLQLAGLLSPEPALGGDEDHRRGEKEPAGSGRRPLLAVATHVHFDHSGGLHQFEEVAVHSAEAAALRRGDNYEAVTWLSDSEVVRQPSPGWTARQFRVRPVQPTHILQEEHIMRKVGLDESPVGIKIAGRNINNLRYLDDTTLMAESEEELKSLLMWVKEESAKVGLKLNIKKTKIMASGPLTFWQIDGEEMEVGTDFIFLGSKITADRDCSQEIKRHLLLGRKAMANLDSILKSRNITLPTKVCIVKAMVFPVVISLQIFNPLPIFCLLFVGDVISLGDRQLTVMHMPGHSRGSICLHDRERKILFSGDVVYDGSMIDWLPYSRINDYVETCQRLIELVNRGLVEKVLPGHFNTFGAERLYRLASNYISNAGVCHKVSTCAMRSIASLALRATNSRTTS
ncbi:Metallo-beta-lactamase domain-containing protein 2 [Varanus komodoensis]|nr:Metallo-beta-lactamase domain-containing protein 2 [Varanus komodoensis]